MVFGMGLQMVGVPSLPAQMIGYGVMDHGEKYYKYKQEGYTDNQSQFMSLLADFSSAVSNSGFGHLSSTIFAEGKAVKYFSEWWKNGAAYAGKAGGQSLWDNTFHDLLTQGFTDPAFEAAGKTIIDDLGKEGLGATLIKALTSGVKAGVKAVPDNVNSFLENAPSTAASSFMLGLFGGVAGARNMRVRQSNASKAVQKAKQTGKQEDYIAAGKAIIASLGDEEFAAGLFDDLVQDETAHEVGRLFLANPNGFNLMAFSSVMEQYGKAVEAQKVAEQRKAIAGQAM